MVHAEHRGGWLAEMRLWRHVLLRRMMQMRWIGRVMGLVNGLGRMWLLHGMWHVGGGGHWWTVGITEIVGLSVVMELGGGIDGEMVDNT